MTNENEREDDREPAGSKALLGEAFKQYRGKYPELRLPCQACGATVTLPERRNAATCPICEKYWDRSAWADSEPGICLRCGGCLFRKKDHKNCGVVDRPIRAIFLINDQIVTSSQWLLDRVVESGRLEDYLTGDWNPLAQDLEAETVAVVQRTKDAELRVFRSAFLLERAVDVRWCETDDAGLVPTPSGLRLTLVRFGAVLPVLLQAAVEEWGKEALAVIQEAVRPAEFAASSSRPVTTRPQMRASHD